MADYGEVLMAADERAGRGRPELMRGAYDDATRLSVGVERRRSPQGIACQIDGRTW